jgi:hypothetical protein
MQCSNRAAWALVAVLCAADAVLGNRVRTLFHNHVEIDHGANGEGGENRRDGDFRDD